MSQAPPVKSVEARSNNIDALRLILSLLVLFSHSFPLGTGSETYEPLAWLTGQQITLGGLAVDWFFVFSGYLITQSWERSRSTWSFLQKRVYRIYPGFLVAVGFCCCVVVPLASSGGFRALSWRTLAANLGQALILRYAETTATFPTNPSPGAVNGSLWSISYEFWCYIGVVGLGLTQLIRRKWWIAGFFAASLGISFVFAVLDLRPGGKILGLIFGYPPYWARLLPYYLAGVVAYRFRDRLHCNRRLALLAVVGLIVGSRVPYGILLTLPTLGTYLLFYLAFTTDWKWHNAARYGDFSYGIYLYAFPIQQLIMQGLGRPVNPLVLFGLAFAPTVGAGVASWYLVERRFLRRSHARPDPKEVRAAAGSPPELQAASLRGPG